MSCSVVQLFSVAFKYVTITDTYKLDSNYKFKKHKFTKSQKKKINKCYGNGHHRDNAIWADSDPEFLELQDHIATYEQQKVTDVPLQIISPVTQLTWLWMCKNWRLNFDFNFKRPSNWNNDSAVTKFNHTWYVKHHNILD